MESRKQPLLPEDLVVESLVVETFPPSESAAATTYITAVVGLTCTRHPETNCGPQICNAVTEVCF